MPKLPANWQATGGGPAGHGASLGGGNYQYNGLNANDVENAVNAITAKGVATVVSTTNQTGTYSQPGGGSSGVGATFTYTATGATIIDGYTLAANDTLLLTGQTLPKQNGLYLVSTAGTTGVATVLTRVPALNSSADFPGAGITVTKGTIYSASEWICTTTGTIVLGTTALTFVQPSMNAVAIGAASPAPSVTTNTVVLPTLGSAPAAASGKGMLYVDTGGSLHYLNNSGDTVVATPSATPSFYDGGSANTVYDAGSATFDGGNASTVY